jgi:hypothetical protein
MEERLVDGGIPRMRSGIADLCDGERSVMKTYYLQQHEEDGRWLIDSTFPLKAHRVSESREARCWIEAKKAFGYELSAVQEALLEKFEKSLTTKGE